MADTFLKNSLDSLEARYPGVFRVSDYNIYRTPLKLVTREFSRLLITNLIFGIISKT